MTTINIYKSNGDFLCEASSPEYNGTFMGERSVTVTIKSHTEINFSVGDYLDYRGERFTLYLLPALTKVAREGTYGAAIEYRDLKFCSVEEELRRCMFLDVVHEDNGLHYTMLPNFSFYCEKPTDFAFRLQANLERQYPGKWTINVPEDVKFIEGVNLSFSSNSCWDALTQVNTNDDIDINFYVNGARRTITIGGSGDVLDLELKYGKGNGLKSIERTVDTSQAVISRLYAYGNTRNLPYRYYNKRYSEGTPIYQATNSMYLPNLMLPGICMGWIGEEAKNILEQYNMCLCEEYTENGYQVYWDEIDGYYYEDESGEKFKIPYSDVKYKLFKHYSLIENTVDSYYCDRVWIDSLEAIKEFGVLEGVKFFDGSDTLVEDVYPSIESFDSATTLAEALDPNNEFNDKYNFYDSAGLNWEETVPMGVLNAIAQYEPGEHIGNDGNIPEEETGKPTFDIIIKNIGFDPTDTVLKADDTSRISMKSGMCVGREFNILSSQKMVYYSGDWNVCTNYNKHKGPWGYKLRCEVAADESINQYFPNGLYPIAKGDEFVILGINMPNAYIDVAERKLVKNAIIYLSENDKTQFTFTPKIDNIFFANNPDYADKLREGNVLHIVDTNLGIDTSLPISTIKITNTAVIPEYEITLSDEQEASLVQRVSTDVKQTFSKYIYVGGKTSTSNKVLWDLLTNIYTGAQYIKSNYGIEVIGDARITGHSQLLEGIETGDGNNSSYLDDSLRVISQGSKNDNVYFGYQDVNILVEGVGNYTVKGSFTYMSDSGSNSTAYIPVFVKRTNSSIKFGKIVCYATYYEAESNQTVTNELESINIGTNGHNEYFVVKLLDNVDAVYTIEVSVIYEMNSEVVGSLRIRLGNPNSQILVQQEYNTDRKSIAYFSPDGLVIEKYKGFELVSGVKFGTNGIQFYEMGEWKFVELQLI